MPETNFLSTNNWLRNEFNVFWTQSEGKAECCIPLLLCGEKDRDPILCLFFFVIDDSLFRVAVDDYDLSILDGQMNKMRTSDAKIIRCVAELFFRNGFYYQLIMYALAAKIKQQQKGNMARHS